MIQLLDTFNSVLISTHRTVIAAVKASRAHNKAVKRRNGPGSYIPYGYRDTTGKPIDPDDITAAQMTLDQEM